MENELAILIGSVAGAVLSLFFKYVPGINVKWDQLKSETKQMFMGLALVLTAAAMYGVACIPAAPEVLVVVSCGGKGLTQVAFALFGALTSNQGVDRITPNAKAVLAARGQ